MRYFVHMSYINVITAREVAERLQVSTRQVSRLVERGAIAPVVKAPGPRGAFLFDPAAVEEFKEGTK